MWRSLKRATFAVLGFCAVLLVITLIGALVPGARAQFPDEEATTEIGLIAGPIHSDLLLPLTPDIRRHFAFAAADGVEITNLNARWLLVGCGARDF